MFLNLKRILLLSFFKKHSVCKIIRNANYNMAYVISKCILKKTLITNLILLNLIRLNLLKIFFLHIYSITLDFILLSTRRNHSLSSIESLKFL